MQALLDRQRAAFTAAMPEPLAQRRDRLSRAIALLVDHAEDFAAAASADFGHRSRDQTLLTDIMPSLSALKFARANLTRWARGSGARRCFRSD